ncbi:hypothetical protein M9M90_01025 [Phenylobacterium sp. LH3H17]|uniref:hypothetical protein n=1 Tax=Phenylobacterium sp. LH3H17 TaxID=2903901 RepID=UPI0020CA18F6|nr:hypothetical protein [Phenylobacterium sp. LH3H17]UTP39787.1 hypothetical protein M9M90_01025 [Phenylobacterium sp. LH3H17]
MDLTVIKDFLKARLSTREAMEEAAAVAGISLATAYRYKSNPEAMSLGVLTRLSEHFGLPLANGAAWGRMDVLGSERRRLSLETTISAQAGARFMIMAPYTVNDELADITRELLRADYGTRAAQLEGEILSIRGKRAELYRSETYDSWEIWNGLGYADFFHGRGRFAAIPEDLRRAQIDVFLTSSASPKRHRYFYTAPDLPTFGCYSDPGVALVRIEDIHLEFQAPTLVSSFEDTFNELLNRCETKTRDDFVDFAKTPPH